MKKKNLHVLFLASWYPSRVFPQNGDFIQRHAQAVALLHQVTVLHVVTDPTINELEIEIQYDDQLKVLIAYLPKTSNQKKWLTFLGTFRRLLRKVEQFDLIHVHRLFPAGLVALYLNKKLKIPYLVTEHFTGYLPEKIVEASHLDLFLGKLISKNAFVLANVSNNLNDAMKRAGFKGSYAVVPNVVKTSLFQPLPKDTVELRILHISSLEDKHKNVSGILNTIAKLQNENIKFHFTLIGPHPERYQETVLRLKLQPNSITLMDQIEHGHVAAQMQKADLLVLFSNYENLPCVILEAFSCGLPVIATNVGGISEFFPSGFGKLIPKNDEKALFDAIINFQKEQKPDKLQMHLYAKEHFSPQVVAKKFDLLYQKAVKNA